MRFEPDSFTIDFALLYLWTTGSDRQWSTSGIWSWHARHPCARWFSCWSDASFQSVAILVFWSLPVLELSSLSWLASAWTASKILAVLFQQAQPIAPISRGGCLQFAGLLSPSLLHLLLHQSKFVTWGHHRWFPSPSFLHIELWQFHCLNRSFLPLCGLHPEEGVPNCEELQQLHSTTLQLVLYVERSLGVAGTCIEDWMIIFYTDPPTACLQTASVDPLIAVFSVLCLAQSSIATFWTCCVGHVWEDFLLLQPLDKTKATEGEDLVNTEPPSLTMLAVLLCFFPCLT